MIQAPEYVLVTSSGSRKLPRTEPGTGRRVSNKLHVAESGVERFRAGCLQGLLRRLRRVPDTAVIKGQNTLVVCQNTLWAQVPTNYLASKKV